MSIEITIVEFATTTSILYSGLISLFFAIIVGLMIAWRNIRMMGVAMFPLSIIPIIVGFRPNIVILILLGIIFIVSSWTTDDINIKSMGLGETPVFQNR
jgi:hypothetical protein